MTPPSTMNRTSGAPSGARPPQRTSLPGADREGGRNVGLGLLALLGSLALLVGVPAALVVFVGNPLPTTTPSPDWLTVPVTPELVINVLAVLIWVVWVHFLVCFLTEWRALRTGAMPERILMGGGSQLLARQLVAGILLLAGGASIASGIAAAAAAPAPTTPVTTHVQVHGVDQAGALEGAHDLEKATPKGKKFTTVKPPDGRHHDTLWDIAERTLGDPLRYKEIVELNRDRLMPDGRRFVDPDLIHPGWQLHLPADAKGPDVHVLHEHAPGGGGAGSGSADETAADQGATDLAEAAGLSGGASGDLSLASADEGDGFAQLALGGGLVLAGLLTALTAKRGPYGTPGAAETDLRLAANAGRADLLDRALRVLSETRSAQGLPLPDIAVVYLNDNQVVLHVVGDRQAPAAPWTVAEDGRSWLVHADDLVGLTSSAPAPYPALVNVATKLGFDVLVDLEYAAGMLAVGGHAGVAREVVMSLAVDLATHQWSDRVTVSMVGFGGDISAIAPERIRAVGSVAEALTEVERQIDAAAGLLAEIGAAGVLAGRTVVRRPELAPHVIFLSAPPSSEETARIRSLAAKQRVAFAVVCVGDSVGARWRFAVDQSGNIDLGAIGVTGTARRLSHGGLGAFRELLAEVDTDARESRTALTSLSLPEAAARAGATQPEESDDVVPGSTRIRPAFRPGEGAGSPAGVRLLGPVAVSGPGPVNPARRDLLTELVVLAAVHPQGLHDAALRAALWERGVEDDVVAATLSEAQTWLGTGPDGTPRLAQDPDGLWRLHHVYVDLADLTACAANGAPAALRHALELGSGEAFSRVPAGRYGWLAFHRAARDTRALVTVLAARAAAADVSKGDRAGAERALRQGLAMVPAAESLWRDLIRLQGGPGPAAAVIAEMHRALPEHRFEAETDALVAHVAPQRGVGS